MLNDTGILPDSVRYYHEPDAFTAAYLYHAPHVGIYHCSGDYQFQRTADTCLSICQALLVDQGELSVHYRGEVCRAAAGALVLLDCREPHFYHAASDDIHFRWFHIVGCSDSAYVNEIIRSHGFVIQTARSPQIEPCFSQIVSAAAQENPNPHLLSVRLQTLLALLASLSEESQKSELERSIDESAQYIESHYADKDVTIPFLAARAALSTCYYLRKFKEYRAITPHQYLQSVRLRAAKQQLTTSSRSVEEIAEGCGFCNTSHFVMAFRKATGMTPLQYRTLWK